MLSPFFTKLVYNMNERLVRNSAAMGFGSELLNSAINSIERLASEDGSLFEVYLVELKSVTAAITCASHRPSVTSASYSFAHPHLRLPATGLRPGGRPYREQLTGIHHFLSSSPNFPAGGRAPSNTDHQPLQSR
jgi:hypothetical protein